MARTLAIRAQICESILGCGPEAIALAQRVYAAASDPDLKKEMQDLTENLRSKQTP
jgi:hypothetical protein